MQKLPITLAADGYFRRGDRYLMPVGINYWPASCGVDMWQAWPAQEIQHDLDLVKSLGLNCVRFFLRWPDFEPTLGHHDERMFDRLRQLLHWCAERDLLAHPALITGFMSGGHFWPADKGQRNLYADPLLVERSAALCRRAAAVIAPFHADLLAVDLGNELGCADAWSAPPAAIRAWCDTVTNAIRETYPQALIVSGLDSGQVNCDYGWRLGEQPGTNFYSAHTYPVPNWNVVPFDGMTDPFCQAILPFCVLAMRNFGPVMVQEFSAILTCGKAEIDSYLDAVLPACLAAGANGFLWWCLRDVRATVHPYLKAGFESRLGLLDANDQVKPTLAGTLRFLQQTRDWSPPPAPAPAPETALYWPLHYYRRDNPENPGNDPSATCRRMLAAYYLLGLAGRQVAIVRGGQPWPATVKTLVIPGALLTSPEIEALAAWVKAGGRVLWSGPAWPQWTETCDALLGAQPVDIRTPKTVQVDCFGAQWTLPHFPAEGRVAIRLLTATPVATGDDGTPVVLVNRLGAGRVVWVAPIPEETVATQAADRPARDRWQAWYNGLLALLDTP